MLVLKRNEGQWVEVTHRSGDLLRIRVCNIEGGNPRSGHGHLNLAFDDDARNFDIERPERRRDSTPNPSEVASDPTRQLPDKR